MNEITLEEARNIFTSAERIVILSHYRPDGDCIGSAAALVLAARKLGKKAFAADSDELPQKLSFIVDIPGDPIYAISGEEADAASDAVSE